MQGILGQNDLTDVVGSVVIAACVIAFRYGFSHG